MRLIDADSLPYDEFVNHRIVMWEDIERSKTIDAIPVVRCKDCILDREAQCPMKYGTEADDYCSFGERMEDEVN